MKLNHDKDGWWLHCGPCAATYMQGVKKVSRDKFLAHYARRYREKRGDNQLVMFEDVIA